MLARTAFVLAAVAASVSAQLTILAPGGDNLWWVANSENNIVWTCQTSPYQNFTVLVANSDPKILVAPQAITAIQNNFDCSKTLTTQQANYTVATGYTIQLANPFNSTQIYAESQPFEVKAQGAAYPATSATPAAGGSSTAASGSSTATASGSNASSSDSSAAVGQMSFSPSAFGGFLVAALAMLAL